LTERLNAPVAGSGATVRSCFQRLCALRAWSATFATPRTVPVSSTRVPGRTGLFGSGGCSESTSTPNQVERRWSAEAAVPPATGVVVSRPRR
jgi:hypothetical protein